MTTFLIRGYDKRLQDACQCLNLSIDDKQIQQLLSYLQHLQRWNRTYNLTAIREREKMLVQHLFDCLAVIKPLEDHLMLLHREPYTLYDVGSGAGLPGIVLAIMRTHWQISCIDAVEKKAAFVRHIMGTLKLKNLNVHHSRIEDLVPAQCDLIIARAFSCLSTFVELAGKHLSEQGKLVAMKGVVPKDEITQINTNVEWQVEKIDSLSIPELEAQRCLVWISRSFKKNHESIASSQNGPNILHC